MRTSKQTFSARNRNKIKSKSKYKGITFRNYGWVANIKCDNILHYVGYFKKEKDAARAYDEAALILFGKRSITNQMMYPEDFK